MMKYCNVIATTFKAKFEGFGAKKVDPLIKLLLIPLIPEPNDFEITVIFKFVSDCYSTSIHPSARPPGWQACWQAQLVE